MRRERINYCTCEYDRFAKCKEEGQMKEGYYMYEKPCECCNCGKNKRKERENYYGR